MIEAHGLKAGQGAPSEGTAVPGGGVDSAAGGGLAVGAAPAGGGGDGGVVRGN